MKMTTRQAIMFASTLITQLAKLNPDEVLEFDEFLGFKVVKPVRKIFDEMEAMDIIKHDIIYFDYYIHGEGPITRVGKVLESNEDDDVGYILLWDYSVNGIRRFDRKSMCNIHYLVEIDHEDNE